MKEVGWLILRGGRFEKASILSRVHWYVAYLISHCQSEEIMQGKA